jgi:hypothetical protein
LGALVVEDEQVLVDFYKIDVLAGEEAGDVESGLPDLDDPVACHGGAADPVPADRAVLVAWSERIGFRCRFPSLQRRDPARGCLSSQRNRVWWKRSSFP